MSENGRALEILERIAVGVEKLNEEPVIHFESGPPMCPFCGVIPNVELSEDHGQGPLSEFVIRPKCMNCENEFYAIPVQWAMFTNREEAEAEINLRAEALSE